MYRSAALALALAATVVGCGGGSAGGENADATSPRPQGTTTLDDQGKVSAKVLTWSDLGEEWETYDGSEDPVAAELACFRYDDAGLEVTASDGTSFIAGQETLLVAGKVFVRPGQFANSSVLAFKTEDQAHVAFDRMTRSLLAEPLWQCMLRAEEVPKGPRMAGVRTSYAPSGKLPDLADETWRHQGAIQIAKKGGTIWIDIFVLREKRYVGVMFFSSVDLDYLPQGVPDEFIENAARTLGVSLAQ